LLEIASAWRRHSTPVFRHRRIPEVFEGTTGAAVGAFVVDVDGAVVTINVSAFHWGCAIVADVGLRVRIVESIHDLRHLLMRPTRGDASSSKHIRCYRYERKY